ncbi:cadherin EGF LAG seven-pass G-type receptor fmi-1-like [Alosa sapidissima]|uniref:cadherin EGF LAG seven-pass G-type receptor fmi-1-like n=1 Tax=Alosa sapidissima TaxID=34773 RepID=UPI001C09D10E|nr:cadherin EGF LAG seven-pass G-type receptor fmi-1-like [Alosa sapidissima]
MEAAEKDAQVSSLSCRAKKKLPVVVSVADVNEPPVIDAVAYSRVISNEMPPGYPVVKVEATDPDVGETLRYSLVEPRSMFAVEPSSGQVYVVSVAGQSGIVSLQVKVEDQHGLYDTTRVEVTIEDVSNSVTISLNQPHDVVMDKVMEMKEALQKALGLDVEIISVTEGSDGETLVVLIAKETSGNILPAEDLKNAFINEKEKVQTELAVVFGPDVDFEIFEKDSDTTMTIILATVIPVIGIATIVAAVLTIRRQRGRKAERRNSENSLDIRGNF